MKPPVTAYSFRAERVALTLGVVAAILVVLHLLAMQAYFNPALGLKESLGLHYWHVSIFDLDAEASFGTWLSSMSLLMAAMLLLHHARVLRAQHRDWHRWWMGLAVGFLVLSVDEIVGLHEWVNTAMEETPWTVVALPILVVVAMGYLPFLWHHRWRTATLFVTAGAIFVGGAVGVEHYTNFEVNSLHYNMWTTLEEGMEMFGVILFLYAVLDHIRGTPDRVLRVEVGLEGSG